MSSVVRRRLAVTSVPYVPPPAPTGTPGGDTPTGSPASGQLTTFTPGANGVPAIIPKSAPEIRNPQRGLFDWNNAQVLNSGTIAPIPEPESTAGVPTSAYPSAAANLPLDIYERDQIRWGQIEQSQGVYNWTYIDSMIATAKARGGKYGFRVVCYGISNAGWVKNNGYPATPGYITGNQGTYGGQGDAFNYWPNFNNNAFLTRVEALWAAIGSRYGANRGLGMMDVGIYGNFGEWHTFGAPGDGTRQITLASAQRIIDCHMAALPLANWTMSYGDPGMSDVMHYAAGKVTTAGHYCGFRNDSYDTSNNGTSQTNQAAWTQTPNPFQDQWKRAIIVGEPNGFVPRGGGDIGWGGNTSSWGLARQHVSDFHYSMVANGNNGAWKDANSGYYSLFTQDQQDWINCGKNAGYRFELRGMVFPTTIEAGSYANIRSTWINVNVAPAYEDWYVTYSLKNAAGAVVWSRTSSRNFRFFLPAQTATETSDFFNMPADLPAGTHKMCVSVVDPSGYYQQPMWLPLYGRDATGRYPIGNVVVPA